MIFQPRSLQQRTFFFILIPTFAALVVLSTLGYLLVSKLLLTQWGEMAVLRLQRTAHQIEMRLNTPKELIMLLQGAEDSYETKLSFNNVLKQIKSFPWVVDASVKWPEEHGEEDDVSAGMMAMKGGRRMMHQFDLELFQLSPPRYNNRFDSRTVSMVINFRDNENGAVGRVEVIISFDELMKLVIDAPWWKSDKAYLLDSFNNVLASTSLEPSLEDHFPMRAFGTVNDLEKKTLEEMQQNRSGTVFGTGNPPREISGFYRLSEAPWVMVVIAPGEKILQPIIAFKHWYVGSFALCIILILFFIRLSTNRVAAGIEEVSTAAEELSKGKFGPPLAVKTMDEVGELTKSFNKMSRQLKQRLEMKQAIGVAREIQQNLLPQTSFTNGNIVASGTILYCEETGGDYFDILDFPENPQKVGVVVGDVVGHGLGAALLMTTVRALFRCRIALPGSLVEVITDVNRLLYKDTSVSGSFVTLFYLEADYKHKCKRWIRCGHDPAIVYTPVTGKFSELRGDGIALGVDDGWTFECSEAAITDEVEIVCIGSDGAWEVENIDGKQFGKERIMQILAAGADLHPDEILKNIVTEISSFQGKKPQCDDITLAVVRIG
ncbi:MAG: SpoIIE family protein phosphatase [Desulforhopalus sp.]